MATKMGKRQENLLAKIAAQLGKPVEEIKEVAAPLYTDEARVLIAQSVYNFFTARVRPERKVKESDSAFEARYREWNFKICRHCQGEFAYAYAYDGVAFCSLECVEADLREKTGLDLTKGREPKMRWGIRHPAIVPAPVLTELRSSFSESEGIYDVPLTTLPPKSPEEDERSK
jgi:hypothetical protein